MVQHGSLLMLHEPRNGVWFFAKSPVIGEESSPHSFVCHVYFAVADRPSSEDATELLSLTLRPWRSDPGDIPGIREPNGGAVEEVQM